MSGIGELVRKELLESWRTLRLPVVAGVLLVAGIISPILARFTPEIIGAVAGAQLQGAIAIPAPTVADAVSQVLKNVGQFGGLAAILLAMGSVATEVERGTAAFILVKPVTRAAFLGAKLVVIGLILAIGTSLAVASAAIYTAVLFEPLPAGGWAGLTVTVWLSLAPYAAITFLGSTLSRSPLGAAGIGFAGLVILSIASAIPSIAPFLPAGLAGLGGDALLGRPTADLPGSFAACTAIVLLAIVAAVWSFRRREL